jgi:hypothetical protein
MPRYLWKVSYTTEGAKGLIAEGGSSRKAPAARSRPADSQPLP